MSKREGGALGGKSRAARMTPEERSAAARAAVQSRWAKQRGESPPVAIVTIEARAESAGQSVSEYVQSVVAPEPIAPPVVVEPIAPPEPAAPQPPPPTPPAPVIPVNRKTPKPIDLAKLCIACRRFGAPKWNCPKCRHLLAPAG